MITTETLKLNIGAGEYDRPGYDSIDIKNGHDARSLNYPDGSVDEIYASHILEHFAQREVMPVLKEWIRVLKPGGVLKVAVPDLKVIAEQYLAGNNMPFQSFIMGAQNDEHNFHKVVFDEENLGEALRGSGLIGIRRWISDGDDCSNLPISLNLCGTKPYDKWPKVSAVIGLPRLGFNDFWECACSSLKHLMPVRRVTGCFWEQNITEAIEESIAENDPEWLLTADYDSVFTQDQVFALLDLAMRHPEADAIAPLQVARWHDLPMMTVRGADGQIVKNITREDLGAELIESETAHFGLTLLRASSLKKFSRPWFRRAFDADGKSLHDPDIYFWRKWKEEGFKLFTAMRVPIGHLELMVRWPDHNLAATFQKPAEFFKAGPPDNIWK